MRSRKANSSSRRSELTSIPQMFSQNMFQLQFLVNIFLVSISSRFVHKGQNQFFCQHKQVNQFSVHPTHSHPQHQLHRSRRRRCQSSCSLSNFDHQEHLHQRLSQASRSIRRVLTPPRRGSGDQESSALRRQHVSHQESEGQENQDSEVRESVHEDSDSSAHGQRHVPPQNHESMSQWSSWIRSCLSVSVSLRSLSWRKRQDQGRNQENQEHQEGINQRLSHLYLRASRIMSYVLFYSMFCSFVIFLFNSLDPSNQSSVQKSSAQPFVTEAVLDSTSEPELIASASLASLQPVTSAITSVIKAMSSAVKSAHDAASSALNHPQPSEDVVMVSADPILIVNSQDQPAIESADIRTEIAMSGAHSDTVSGSSAPGSLVKYAIMASLPSERMDMHHLSEDVKLFASNFRTSGDTFDLKHFMDSQAQRHWLILNDAEFKLFSQHHVLQVPRVKEPSGGHILNWKIHESLQECNLSHDLPHRGSLC